MTTENGWQDNKDISVSAKPQYDNRDSSLNATHFTQNDNAKSARNDEKQSKPKRLALSLIAASALTGLALDSLAAGCIWTYRDEGNVGYWQNRNCTGTMTTNELDDNAFRAYYETNYYNTTTINFGLSNPGVNNSGVLNVNGSYATITLKNKPKTIVFGYLNAGNTIFGITGSGAYTELKTSGKANIGGLDLKGNISYVALGHGSSVVNINVNSGATVNTLAITNTAGGASVDSITGSGTINTLTIGGVLGSPIITPKVGAVNLAGVTTLSIGSSADVWNNLNSIINDEKAKAQHIYFSDGSINGTGDVRVNQNPKILVSITSQEANDGKEYKLENLIVAGTQARGQNLVGGLGNMVEGAPGTQLLWSADNKRFYLRADARNSYTANAYRALALSYMRRNAMTENILNTMTTKTFHSDRYYNQEVELRLLQLSASFNWDMRVGFEVGVWKSNTLYANLDIINVLDNQNLMIASATYTNSAGLTAVPVYELGRQFWVQVGYKF